MGHDTISEGKCQTANKNVQNVISAKLDKKRVEIAIEDTYFRFYNK